jgi:hypothetical protein
MTWILYGFVFDRDNRQVTFGVFDNKESGVQMIDDLEKNLLGGGWNKDTFQQDDTQRGYCKEGKNRIVLSLQDNAFNPKTISARLQYLAR